jgi:hypothetical protein
LVQTFVELTKIYNSKGKNCGEFGYIFQPKHKENRVITNTKYEPVFIKKMMYQGKTVYNVKGTYATLQDPVYYEDWIPDRLIDLKCHRYCCSSCRPGLKNKLHNNIVREVCQNNLNYHFIVTAPGGLYRKETQYYDSYKIMMYEFKKLKRNIRYELTKLQKGIKTRSENPVLKPGYPYDELQLKMITLPRAQSKPIENNPAGFCHLHNITNLPLNIDWLEEKISKNSYRIGYQFIRENQNVADYLCLDYFKDPEWYIPFKQKHYITTENLHLNPGQYMYIEPGNILYRNQDLTTYLNDNEFKKYIEWDLNQRGYNLPFEEYVNQFYESLGSNNEVDPIIRKQLSQNEIIKNMLVKNEKI